MTQVIETVLPYLVFAEVAVGVIVIVSAAVAVVWRVVEQEWLTWRYQRSKK